MSLPLVESGQRLIPLPDAARELGKPSGTLRRACREGRLAFFLVHENYYLPRSEIDRFKGGHK